MKMNLVNFVQRVRDKGPAPVVLLIGVIATVVLAMMALGSGLFSETLVAGPEVSVSGPSADPGVRGVTTFTPIELSDDALRVGWSIATAAVLFGIALLFWAAFRLVWKEDRSPIFQAEVASDGELRVVLALIPIAIGGIARSFLTGPVVDAVGISSVEFNFDDDVQLWIFDVPPMFLFFTVGAIGWVWNRGTKLQTEVEHVV